MIDWSSSNFFVSIYLFQIIVITVSKSTLPRTRTTKKTSKTSTLVYQTKTETVRNISCVSNYWPVQGFAVEDVIGGQSAASITPLFGPNRFGVSHEAARVYGHDTSSVLPPGVYIQKEATLTMWVKKFACGGRQSSEFGSYGIKINKTAYLKQIFV
jgi:hypothetical protein